MSFPDVDYIPELPHLRPKAMTPSVILGQARSALHSANRMIVMLDQDPPRDLIFPFVRSVVIELRRSTFMLQKLKSHVDDWEEWWAPFQDKLGADPLMRYFLKLRNQIEKEGLPGAIAELFDSAVGATVGDLACMEDEHGLFVAGGMRPGVEITPGEMDDTSDLRLINIRLPDPPREHQGSPLTDLRFTTLAQHAHRYLESEVLEPALLRFGAASRRDEEE